MKAFLLLVAIFLFSHQAVTEIDESDPLVIACNKMLGSCWSYCPHTTIARGRCPGGLFCCTWGNIGIV
ncbi:hypothetical protein E2320_018414 [Naja naja]|nr:hypothetical protein E2320_018414 [Naja naja]